LIGRFEGKPVSEDGPHVLWIAGDKGLRITNDLRFLNHSADPNAHTDEATLDLLAQRAIAAGEEITIHYGDEWD
jgi:SET domain-containing protein